MMPTLVKEIDDKSILSKRNKTFIFLFALLTVVAMLLLPSAKAQQTVQHEVVDHEVTQDVPLNQAELDQILAPIALYPDSLLSQILVASTYPLEVIQATRWRQANSALDEAQVLSAVESQDWDPSVKALAPFEDLLVRLSEDLGWLQSVGDAFLQNEDQVLASVQNLRQVAYDNGSIVDNDYYQVTNEDDNIIIESTQREIVYVPYYDTRVVYGNWWWDGYSPTYWHRPRNYVHLSGGFYWNSNFFIRPNIFFGGFHWGSRRLVVNHHYYDNYYGYNSYGGYNRNIHVSNYTHWSHNPNHRRGVRYPQQMNKSFVSTGRSSGSANTRNTVNRTVTNVNTRQSNARQTSVNSVQQKLSTIKQPTRTTNAVNTRDAVRTGTTNRTVTTVKPTTNRSTAVTNSRTTINKTTSPRRTSTAVTNTQNRNSTVRQATVNKQTYNRTSATTNKARSSSNTSTAAKTSSVKSTPQTTTTTTTTTTSNRGKWSK